MPISSLERLLVAARKELNIPVCTAHTLRHFGFCHPAARAKRERVAFHTGRPLLIGAAARTPEKAPRVAACPCCGGGMRPLLRLLPAWHRARPPPANTRSSA